MRLRILEFVVFVFVGVAASACSSKTGDEGTTDCDDPRSNASCSELVGNADTPLPAELRHSEADTPVPTWDQLTHRDSEGVATLSRIFDHPGDEPSARARYDAYSPQIRRGLGLLLDKITNEGWLDSIDKIKEDRVFDTAFHFWPRASQYGSFDQIMDGKARYDGRYTENNIQNGVIAYLNSWNHKEWVRGWAENDVPYASLHVGKYADGSVEVHMETYNPVFTNGATLPHYVVVRLPGFGALDVTTWRLHRKWEQDPAMSPKTRTSANYYHFMKSLGLPLSF